MKALSLWNPWATLLVHGKKRVETRGWDLRHRGPLLIHAAKRWTDDTRTMCLAEPFKSALEAIGYRTPQLAYASNLWIGGENAGHSDTGPYMPGGAIVGRVTVVACYPSESVFIGHTDRPETIGNSLAISHTEHEFGDYSPGRFAILCGDFVAFKTPIPFAGKQGLFEVPDSLIKTEAR